MSQKIPAAEPPARRADAVTATVWPWWRVVDDVVSVSRVRRGAVVRTLVGLVIAALLLLWKPWLAALVTVISILVLALALVSPLGLYARFEYGLDRLAHGVGLAVTWILMPILYLLLFLPVGLALRTAGKLRLTRRPDPGAATYWRAPQRGGGDGVGDSGGDDGPGRWQGCGLERYRRQF